MIGCILWGANTIIWAALAAHPALPLGWRVAVTLVAVACWLRGFYLAGRA